MQRKPGARLVVRAGFARSAFGDCLVATQDRGICAVSFVESGGRTAALDELRQRWPKAVLQRDDSVARPVVRRLAAFTGSSDPIPALLLHGTDFQLRVWKALLRIPPAHTATYQDVAVAIGMPNATRAVGTAIGRNPVAIFVPCHRVVRKDGGLGGYRWGTDRKRAILAWEAAGADERRENAGATARGSVRRNR